MPRYVLFAARDGDVFREESEQPQEEAALAWAAERISAEFGLERLRPDFDEVVGNCDGVLLEPEDDPLDKFAEEWAIAQTRVLSALEKHYGSRLKKERSACLYALVDLANALRPDQP